MAFKTVRKSYVDNRLNSYNAFHGELDPYRSFASTSQLVTEQDGPLAAVGKQHQLPAVAAPTETTTSATKQSADAAVGVAAQPQQAQTPVTATSSASAQPTGSAGSRLQTGPIESIQDDLVRSSNDESAAVGQKRVRREDADERDSDDADDDGVWVDDDEDDDGRQQSSDVNETTQEPEDGDDSSPTDDNRNTQTIAQLNPPGVIGGPHGYELSPANDLMIYHGRR